MRPVFQTAAVLTLLFSVVASSAEAKSRMDSNRLQELLDKTVDGKRVLGVALNVCSGSGDCWSGSSGNLEQDSQYFIASVTKLYTTAIVCSLVASGQIELNDPISSYLPNGLDADLHRYKGVDLSDQITIRHLLSQSSGLPDDFEQGTMHAPSLKNSLVAGEDRSWTL